MTARPIFPESRRKPIHVAVALCFVMMAVLLVAGTAGQADITPVSQMVTAQTIAMSDKDQVIQIVTDGEAIIQKTDVIIAWFKGNASTSHNPRLPAVIMKREIAFSSLSTAKNEIRNGNYDRARESADDAFRKANESYYDALQLQEYQSPIYPTSCEPRLPFDKMICILLIGLVPVLLTVLIYSLAQTNPAAGNGRLRRFMGTTTVYVLFIGISLIFAALATGVKIANIAALRQWMYLALVPWVCLMLSLTILSVLVIGCEVFPLVLSNIFRKPEPAGTEMEDQRSPVEKTWHTVKIIVTILLIFTMPQVLYVGLSLAYPVLCM